MNFHSQVKQKSKLAFVKASIIVVRTTSSKTRYLFLEQHKQIKQQTIFHRAIVSSPHKASRPPGLSYNHLKIKMLCMWQTQHDSHTNAQMEQSGGQSGSLFEVVMFL